MDFGAQVVSQILQKEVAKGSDNVLGSPLSINVMLNLIAAAATGSTLAQFLQYLDAKTISDLNARSSVLIGLTNPPPLPHVDEDTGSEDLTAKAKARYLELIDTDDDIDSDQELEYVVGKGPVVSFVNGVWLDQSLGLKLSYQQIIGDVYKATARHVDFQNKADEVAAEVNSWVNQNTNGVIKSVLHKLSPNTSIILANALYFKGDWFRPFKKQNTQDKEFYLLNGETARVPYMSERWKSYYYSDNKDFKLLKLRYEEGQDNTRRFSMYIFLPHERNGLNNLIQKHFIADPGFIRQHFNLYREKIRELRVPKFKFMYETKPAEVIKELGLTLPFEEDAEFDISDSHVKIPASGIIHMAGIEVNEEGTEAAAVSVCAALGCSLDYKPPPPQDFIADHPFVFMIREDNSGLVFFLGALLNPLL